MWPEIVKFTVPLVGKEITIYSYGTVIVIAFLLAAWWTRRKAHALLGLDRERVFNVCFALLFIGIGGARLLHALVHYGEFTKRPLSFLYIWEGGLVWYGGVIADLLWLAWYLQRHPDMKGFAFLDVLVRGSALGIFLGRWASFLAGDDYGRPTSLPWGVPVTWTSGVETARRCTKACSACSSSSSSAGPPAGAGVPAGSRPSSSWPTRPAARSSSSPAGTPTPAG